MSFDERLLSLGIELPDLAEKPYTGTRYGRIRPHRLVGSLLFLSGHIPEYPDGTVLHPGCLGLDLTVEQGYEAARLAGINVLAGIRFALGNLDRVAAIVQTLNFVVCTDNFHDTNLVANGVTDLLADVFGDDIGTGGRATTGVTSLLKSHCFETVVTVEVHA
jgi:enamine deaminase RidA (YjgF/YER057c/UK114 family)